MRCVLPKKFHERATVVCNCSHLRVNFRTIPIPELVLNCCELLKLFNSQRAHPSNAFLRYAQWTDGQMNKIILLGLYWIPRILSTALILFYRVWYVLFFFFFFLPEFLLYMFCSLSTVRGILGINNLSFNLMGHWTTRSYLWVQGEGFQRM